MEIVDMYEYFRMQHNGSDDFHFDYIDHDDSYCNDNHLDEYYYYKDYDHCGIPYIERIISSDLNRFLFYCCEYLNNISELQRVNIKFVPNTEVFKFEAHSLTDYSILILPTIADNYILNHDTDLSLKEYNTDRYYQISSLIDISNEVDNLIFSILHEVGHCIHISTQFSSLNEYFSICNNCKYADNDSRKGVCNNCSEEKKQKICNYYCEITADKFAFKHFSSLKELMFRGNSNSDVEQED